MTARTFAARAAPIQPPEQARRLSMSKNIQAMSGDSKLMLWAGWIMSAAVVLFLLLDGVMKLLLVEPVIEATRQIGYPLDVIRPLGIICLVCAVLYAIPRTAILGAILLTGFLGRAI